MKNYDFIKFFRSLLNTTLSKEELFSLLDKTEPYMTDKKKDQFMIKLNLFINEKEKKLTLKGYSLNEGKKHIMGSASGRASAKGKLTDKNTRLKKHTSELDSLYTLRTILNEFPKKR